MDAQEFRKDFLENVKAEAAATGEGSCAAFVGSWRSILLKRKSCRTSLLLSIQVQHPREKSIV